MSCLPKPNLRGHHVKRGIRLIAEAMTVSGLVGAAFYFFVAKPRDERFSEFFSTYDPEAHYQELVKYGLIWAEKKEEE